MLDRLHYFRNSLVFTVAALAAAGGVGHFYGGSLAAALQAVFIAAVLSVLEVSLSFDNAVVNASVLRHMSPLWQRRFLTWGIAIAVFGMRLVFPLAIVGVVARLGPLEALRLAVFEPATYARVLSSAHVVIAAFGGAFLGMVSLRYFVDAEKEIHWLSGIEAPLARIGKIEAVELAFAMTGLYFISRQLPGSERLPFLEAGLFGLVTFIVVDGITALMESGEAVAAGVHRASAGLFLYLEVLDASFSFDGVIGAFALTNNLFVIALGLGTGAMFVRSLTILLVDRGTLGTYRYLEHGAFYAIGALSAMMFLGTLHRVPEVVTGLIGAVCIGLSLWASIRHNRREAAAVPRRGA